ncbi:hypothetical protein ACUOFC_16505, partial [Escherichia sp. TWPC-MK]
YAHGKRERYHAGTTKLPRNDDAIGFIESHGESLCSVCSSLLYPDRCITRQLCSTSVMTFAFAVCVM